MFTVGKSRSILLLQILYNAVKRLIFFKSDELSQSTAFTFKTLLIFLEYIFEFLMNKAPPASDSVYQHNFTAKSFKYYNPPTLPPVLWLFCIVFTYWLVSVCLYCCPCTPSRGETYLVVTIIRLSNKNDVIVQMGYFTVF